MLRLQDLTIDPCSLGNVFWLVDVRPVYEYRDDRRTDKVTAYRYIVALPDKGLERIAVKIDGEQQLEAPNGYVEVDFVDLELYLYWAQGQPQIGARAQGIVAVSAAS